MIEKMRHKSKPMRWRPYPYFHVLNGWKQDTTSQVKAGGFFRKYYSVHWVSFSTACFFDTLTIHLWIFNVLFFVSFGGHQGDKK